MRAGEVQVIFDALKAAADEDRVAALCCVIDEGAEKAMTYGRAFGLTYADVATALVMVGLSTLYEQDGKAVFPIELLAPLARQFAGEIALAVGVEAINRGVR
ncbi:MAG: hypothetical protein JWO85_2160 [Candidatus Eremiobacteraeota bacterium]|nr:hypothetical protein [Candidatus Eremiobacteraeota bacterium]